MKPGHALLILELENLGSAYQALQTLPADLETFELIPTASKTLLLVSGEKSALTNWQPKGELCEVSEAVVQAYLGLESPPLQKALGCFETSSCAEAFRAAAQLEKTGWKPFDLRILRGSPMKVTVLATATTADAADLKNSQGQWTRIQNPSTAIRSFFDMKP